MVVCHLPQTLASVHAEQGEILSQLASTQDKAEIICCTNYKVFLSITDLSLNITFVVLMLMLPSRGCWDEKSEPTSTSSGLICDYKCIFGSLRPVFYP